MIYLPILCPQCGNYWDSCGHLDGFLWVNGLTRQDVTLALYYGWIETKGHSPFTKTEKLNERRAR